MPYSTAVAEADTTTTGATIEEETSTPIIEVEVVTTITIITLNMPKLSPKVLTLATKNLKK